MNTKKKAVVLLSGGLDSVTCLAVAKHEDFEVHALTFDYDSGIKSSWTVPDAAPRKSVWNVFT